MLFSVLPLPLPLPTVQYIQGQCVQAQQQAHAQAVQAAGLGFAGSLSPGSPGSVPGVAPALTEEEKEALADEAVRHTAYGPGLVEAVRGEVARFSIQSNDEAGNPLTVGGLPFEAFIADVRDIDSEGNAKHSIPLTAVDQSDGTYTVEYTRLEM